MKRESKSRRKHQWRERQSSDGETRRNWKKALSLLEEEVWRKGLGKTERGVALIWPRCFSLFCSTLVHLSIHAHPVFNHPLSSYSLWGWPPPPPSVKVCLRKLWFDDTACAHASCVLQLHRLRGNSSCKQSTKLKMLHHCLILWKAGKAIT